MTDTFERLKTALADRYAIQEELGAGGMATVYLAEDIKHHRQVAVKVLRPDLAAALGPERFLREIEIAANLTHPHILPLHDSGEAAGFLYYVMPYIEGESLRDRLVREKQLPVDDAIEITRQVARALAYAHARNVVHRDIKPENILLAGGEAVVADFGIAKAIHAAGGESLTETGLAIGTPWYMSPEQAAGTSDVDGRTDVYALGCMLYESLGGEPPYTGSTPQAIVARKLAEPVPSLRVLRETVSPALEEVIFQALARAPADRFATATQFADALAQASSGDWSPTAERMPSGTVPASGRRVRLATVVTTVAVLAALGGGAWLGSTAIGSGGEDDESLRTIAVLPFDNFSEDTDRAYIANGLTEEITSQLSKIAALRVMSRTAVEQLVAAGRTLEEIGEALNVGTVLEGSVRQAGDQLRVTAQLIEVRTNEHLWSGDYDGALADVFDMQRTVALEIAEALDATLSSDEARRLDTRPTENLAAYDLYQQAKAARGGNADAERRAIDLTRQAIGLDSTFAEAIGYLGWLFTWMGMGTGEPRWADSAEAAGRRALAIDPETAIAHQALALSFDMRGRLAEARLAWLAGLALNPGLMVADFGVLEARLGHLDEALYWAERYLAANPNSANAHFHVAQPLILLGDHERSQRWLDESVEKFPEFRRLHMLSAALDLVRGRESEGMQRLRALANEYPASGEQQGATALGALFTGAGDALEMWERSYNAFPDARDNWTSRQVRTNYGTLLIRAGLWERGNQLFDEAWRVSYRAYEDGNEHYGIPAELAAISAVRGETEEALQWLERAYQAGHRWSVGLRRDPMFDSVREDERFVQLVARIEADLEAMRRRAFNREGSMFRDSLSGR